MGTRETHQLCQAGGYFVEITVARQPPGITGATVRGVRCLRGQGPKSSAANLTLVARSQDIRVTACSCPLGTTRQEMHVIFKPTKTLDNIIEKRSPSNCHPTWHCKQQLRQALLYERPGSEQLIACSYLGDPKHLSHAILLDIYSVRNRKMETV